MTAFEALWLMKAQLQKNDQNLEAIKVLEDIVKIVNRVHIDDNEKTYTLQEAIDYIEMGTEAEHIKNHMEKIARQDIHDLHENKQYHGEWVVKDGVLVYKEVLNADNMCARYDWAEDDELVEFFDLCDTEDK